MPAGEPRFERRGGPPDLPAAFTVFVTDVLGGRALDDNFNAESAKGEFPDFGLYRDLVLIEMKLLEVEQKQRIQTVLDELVIKDEMPKIYGQRNININSNDFSNADVIVRAILSKLARSLEGHLSKANRQFRNYRARHPRKNKINICVILNSKIADYTPAVVEHALFHKMQPNEGHQRFESIDAVLYISEKHFTKLPRRGAAHPVLIYEGVGLVADGWKQGILERLVQAWAIHRTGMSLDFTKEMKTFASVEDIPNRMSRSEAWLLEYARRPYLQHLPLAQLRVQFHRVTAVNSLTFVVGSWPKPPRRTTEQGLRRFQHIIAETNRRGVDMREMDGRKLTASERRLVFEGLPDELVKKLSPVMGGDSGPS